MDCQCELEWGSLGRRPVLAVEGKLVLLRLLHDHDDGGGDGDGDGDVSEWLWAAFKTDSNPEGCFCLVRDHLPHNEW